MLPQVSSINNQFGQAVQYLICTRPKVVWDDMEGYRFPVTFHTKLMLSWAPLIRELDLLVSQISPAGLPAFVALSQLTSLKLRGWLWTGCAYTPIDPLLQQCSHLQTLSSDNGLVPTVYPPSLQRLKLIMPRYQPDNPHCLTSAAVADNLVLQISQASRLQYLTLDLGKWGVLPSVQQLPRLQRLNVSFSLAENKYMDLSWLRAQPCQELWVHVGISFGHSRTRADVIAQLQQVEMQHCHLEFGQKILMLRQAAWQHVRAAGRMLVTVDSLNSPLLHLPSGPELHIKLGCAGVSEHTDISWQALLRAGSCVVIEKGAEHTLKLCSPGGISTAQLFQQPWQLTILSVSLLQGLPLSLPCEPGTYFWQNQAATAAGWKQPGVWNEGFSLTPARYTI